jgi:hypothetical protein
LIGRGTTAAPTTLRDWLNRRSSPAGVTAGRISGWLTNPVEALDDQKPIALIARGNCVRVSCLISTIEDPGAV